MKNFLIILFLLFSRQLLFAQSPDPEAHKELPVISISNRVTLHFISPEDIQYVDISSNALAGDLPVKNILRIKVLPDSAVTLRESGFTGIVTIVGERYIAQYKLVYQGGLPPTSAPSLVNILPEHTRPLEVPGILMSTKEMQAQARRITSLTRHSSIRKAKGYGMQARLNGVYTVEGFVFLDISYYNQTNLPYQIDEQRFQIEDKKITKSTNVQSVEIKPLWQLYPGGTFKKHYRNVYVLGKVTYPGNKVLRISLSEKQLSGRTLSLEVPYKDVLQADSL